MPTWKHLTTAAALLAATFLVSCGGGSSGITSSGSSTAVDPLAPQAQVDLTAAAVTFGFVDDGSAGGGGDGGGGDGGAGGGAGDGAPLKKAVIVLTDATGRSVSGLTDNNGIYFVKFTGFKSPIVARVIDAGGNVLTSVHETTIAPGSAVRININPLTDKIVSDVVVSGTVPGTDKTFDGSKIDVSKIAQAKKDLIASVTAALTSVNVTSTVFDPIKSAYAYDGTGVDAIIESMTHTRDPQSGRTVLRPKLVSVDTALNGEISAATPLAVSAVSTSTSPALTYAKLNNWINVGNACLAQDPNVLANKNCGATGGLVAAGYLHNSMDFDEHFKILISGICGTSTCPVQGSTLRNPVLLFVGKYPNSTASYDDLAVVEVTIRQPGIGNYYGGGFSSPVEYSKIVVFRRDDAFNGAAAGNWILYGNQRNFDFSVEARYDKYVQANPARIGNTGFNATTQSVVVSYNPPSPTAPGQVIETVPAGTYTISVGGSTATRTTSGLDDPSTYSSGIRMFFNPQKFDPVSRTWVSAKVVAAKITGPGLPAAGIVLATTSNLVCGGSTFMSIANANGSMPTTTATFTTGFSTNEYTLASVLADGVTPAWYTTAPGAFATRAKPNTTDFSALGAFNAYRADIKLTDGTTVTESTRILSSLESPGNLTSAQWNDTAPSLALVTSPAISAASNNFNVQWANNANAAFVESVFVNSAAWGPINSYAAWNLTTGVLGGAALSVRPTSQNSGYPSDPNCSASATQYPALSNIIDRRALGIRTYQGRSRRFNTLSWRN